MAAWILGAAALVTAGYHTMAPRSQLYGRTFIGNRRASRQLALTFDDGPNDPHTLRLLEVLERHQVHATFFFIGRFVAERADIAQAVARAGHVIGNHTFTHPNLIFCTPAQVRREITECERALDDAVGPHSRLFRPPFGGRHPAALRAIRTAGFETIMWSVTGGDWKGRPASWVEDQVRRQARGGDVILLHDGGHERMGADRSATVKATDLIIQRYKAEGFEFVTVPEMMKN